MEAAEVRQGTVSSTTRPANSTSFTSSPTEALHHHGQTMSPGPQATHSLCRVLATDLPASLCEPRMALTSVVLHVVAGGCDGGDDVFLVHSDS